MFRPSRGRAGRWTSTALESARQPGLFAAAPPGYLAPPLNWFRGLNLEAKMAEDALTAHAEVVMQLPEAARGRRLFRCPSRFRAGNVHTKPVPPPPPPKPRSEIRKVTGVLRVPTNL